MVRGRNFEVGGVRKERFVNDGYPIDFQLKCSWVWSETPQNIRWSIKTKTYNDLVLRNNQVGGVRALLILMCLPEDEHTWVSQREEDLILRRCCYYKFLTGAPESNENSTKLIDIPRANLLTPEALIQELNNEKARMVGQFDD